VRFRRGAVDRLILAGIGLSALNASSTEDSFDDTLEVYAKALVANVAVSAEEGRTTLNQYRDVWRQTRDFVDRFTEAGIIP